MRGRTAVELVLETGLMLAVEPVEQALLRGGAGRGLGLPLGSGSVESACRLICGLRCKQPGMRWSVRGAQNVLSLRALALSSADLWHDFWAGHPQTRRPLIASLTMPQTLEEAV